MTYKTMTRLCFAVLAAFGVALSAATYAQAQDYSRAYRYGSGVHIPGAPDIGSGNQVEPIVNANLGIDAGGVLGCSGIDLRSMIQNTFEVGDLAGEFKDYLKNTLATEALSLLYSQPGVSQVLDGMKAIGHARAGILQERCNANEILADATNKRLSSEAYNECIKETQSPQECQGDGLNKYLDDIANSARWSGTLHERICPEGEDGEKAPACNFIPNFYFNVNDKQGNETQPSIDGEVARNIATTAANECLEKRGQLVSNLISEHGLSEGMLKIASGEAKIHCGEGAWGDTAGDDTGNDTGNNGGNTGGGSVSDGANAGLSVEESCEVDTEDNVLYADNLEDLMKRANGLTGPEILEKHVKCLIGKDLHGHVDAQIAIMPAVDALGVWRALAEVFATQAVINMHSATIKMLAEMVIESGGSETTKLCERHKDGPKKGEKINKDCKDSINPQELSFISMTMQNLRNAIANAKDNLEMARKRAEINRRAAEEQEEREQASEDESRSNMTTPLDFSRPQNRRPDLAIR